MKKLAAVLLFTVCGVVATAQNVGIGTTNPGARLQVNNNSLLTRPSLLLNDSATAFSGLIKFKNNAYTKGMFLAGFSTSAFNTGQYLDVRVDSLWIATFKGNGKVGIKNTEPNYDLDVIGDINFTGALRTNGTAGMAGQVLTSTGSGSSWTDGAFSNNIRFAFSGETTNSNSGIDTVNLLSTIYNTNAAMVSLLPNGTIQINKTGLYHIDFTASFTVSPLSPKSYDPLCAITLINGSFVYQVLLDFVQPNMAYPASSFTRGLGFTKDIYLQSGTTLLIYYDFRNAGLIGYQEVNSARFIGHLIAE